MNLDNTYKNIARAGEIKKELTDLSYFIKIIDVIDSEKKHTSIKLFKTERKTVKLTAFALRSFHMGHHKQEINLPITLLDDMAKWAHKRENELIEELKGIMK